MRSVYRLLQLTNASVGQVAAPSLIPLGTVTRLVEQQNECVETFGETTNVNNTVYIREPGFYKITYNGFLTAGAAGNVVVNLLINALPVTSATVTAAAGATVSVPITFETRVFDNCLSMPSNTPIQVQLQNNGVALTGGNSNITIERVYKAC